MYCDEYYAAARRYTSGGAAPSKGDANAKNTKMSKEEKLALWGAPGDKKKKKEEKEEKPKEKYVERTPAGEKKLMDAEMAASYDPIAVESAWYDWWEQQGYFTPDAEKCKEYPADKRFVMVIPPPNVTGALHIGHALTAAVEDALTRWHRMHGHATLWVPGVDHAGIATQSVVERILYKTNGQTRHDLGREKFLGEVWRWKEEYGERICKQFRTLAVSVDWTRLRFTMDDMCSKAVKESFVRFFEEGRIFRASRIVNWSCHLRTALSDLEVDYEDIEARKEIKIPGLDVGVEVGVLCHFKYKVKGADAYVTVATTRLETMLGDVAVAVHPDDTRYQHLVGKKLEHPFCKNREMSVIADTYVDKEFGTGCVKITPSHDPNDFQMGKRHKLEEINILCDDGTLNDSCGEFAGQHRFHARRTIEEALKAKGLFDKKVNHKMRLGLCSRSGDIIEPLTRPQWWMKCDDLAKRSLDAVRNGSLTIVPKFHEHVWFHWLENIQDWCISRQLWWGHRIPAYKVVYPEQKTELWFAGRTEEEARAKAQAQLKTDVRLEQDDDVLDTWYSSGLFPFSVMGWPEQTPDLKAFFPGSLLETGHDILFFWVARMTMMSHALCDTLPFHTVYLHPMVRDAQGRKMSKSLGNALDPLEMIYGCTLEELHAKLTQGNLPATEVARAKAGQKKEFPDGIPACGSDALRFGLLAYTAQGRSVNLDINRVVGYKKFCNKLWNVVRFARSYFPEDFRAGGVQFRKLSFEDEWILHRLSVCAEKADTGFTQYQFSDVVMAIYAFWYDELAAVYLECLKPRLRADDVSEVDKQTAREVLYTCLDRGLRLLHPLLPFVTEELFQRLPPSANKSDSIVVAEYPMAVISWMNPVVDQHMQISLGTVHAFRAKKAALGISPGTSVNAFVRFDVDLPECALSPIQILAKLASLVRLSKDSTDIPPGTVEERINDCTIFVEHK